jgi:hypothetical protein
MSSSQSTLPVIHARTDTQLGILFGFVGLFILAIATYSVLWKAYNKRDERLERERERSLLEKGFGVIGEEGKGKERGGVGG